MKENRQIRQDNYLIKSMHFRYTKYYCDVFESITDKEKMRKKIDIATIEYLKNNEIIHLPDTPNKQGYSVKVKDLREISDTEEFYYLEEQNEEW